ncbi:nucleotidyltransferase domain-containing protein [Candidatus Woesearchaeota archaeon]|nr:nucleotidyltransferase domain-containing protein [Candidatus Woesearchaeota archaeon]
MEKIFNSLEPFFNDCYRRINVREYARIMNISPPTASSLLNSYNKQNILKIEKDKGYHLYSANQNSWIFIDLSRMYWKKILEKIKFLEQLEKDFKLSTIILFGSTSKGEITNKSDLDIAIFTPSNPKIDYSIFENKLKRKIQIFRFNSIDEIKNKDLQKNILSSYIIKGGF